MPRMLKTKFPCRDCKVPTEVKRLRDAEHATCAPCSSRRKEIARLHWADEEYKLELKKVNGVESEAVPFLIGWLKALEASVRASRHSLTTLDFAQPKEVVMFTVVARNRARTARRYLEQLAPLFEEVISQARSNRPLQLVEGGAEAPLSELATPPPTLRLIRQEENDT